MVGDALLVAPVLKQGEVHYSTSRNNMFATFNILQNSFKILFATPGARSRDVFLPGSPDGAEIVWKRGTDGPYYKVSTNIYNI